LRRYETIFITPPELPEVEQSELLEKINSLLPNLKGEVIKLEDWGIKRLAYEIRKNTRGHYYLLDYLSGPDSIRELERNLRLNDRILKYQTVKISDQISAEALQALKEAALAKKAVKVAEQPPSAEPEKTEKIEKAGKTENEGKMEGEPKAEAPKVEAKEGEGK
jgi:small subunit ribosomal protein S6